jgi:hypothetical protein
VPAGVVGVGVVSDGSVDVEVLGGVGGGFVLGLGVFLAKVLILAVLSVLDCTSGCARCC